MCLVVKPGFNKKDLTADSYMINQITLHLIYANTRLVKMSWPWESICYTHEYWGLRCANSDDAKNSSYDKLEIDDRNDGGCKADKFERDIRLIKKGLEDDPDQGNRSRYLFYLAQSYKDIGNYDEAIKWYQERINVGGWYEEVWYSHYKTGYCYQEKNDWSHALEWYHKAIEHSPFRAEPYYQIAKYYREHGQNEIAYIYAKHGSQMGISKQSKLFIEYAVYNYEFLRELSILCYYTKEHKEEGLQACEKILFNRDLNIPADIKRHVALNEYHYVPQIVADFSHRFPTGIIDLPIIPVENRNPEVSSLVSDYHWRGINPSIIRDGGFYRMNYRTINYICQHETSKYYSMESDGKIRTRNYLISLDKNFNMIKSTEIRPPDSTVKYPDQVKGFEDCRLFKFGKKFYMTVTSKETQSTQAPQICMTRLTDDCSTIDYFEPLVGEQGPGKCEKNWLPFVKDGEIHIIYGYEPFVVYKYNPKSKTLIRIINKKLPDDLQRFRGSASPIPFDHGYLFVVHEVTFEWCEKHKTDVRHYLHRFVWFDDDFNEMRYSTPFYFRSKNIEFCSGLTLSIDNKYVLLTCGINDEYAELFGISCDRVRKYLNLKH
jgi:hypothetical protein